MKNLKEQGITLIALVVTIIILLILAGVTLQTVTGEHGLITVTRKAVDEHCHSAVKEALEMSATTYEIDKMTNKNNNGLIEYLEGKGIVEDIGEEGSYQINVENLTGKKMKLGNGSDKKDVYMLEEEKGIAEIGRYATTGKIRIAEASSGRKEYLIKYYGKSEEENRDIGKLVDSGTEGSSSNSKEALIKELEEMYYIQANGIYGGYELYAFELYLLPEAGNKIAEYVLSANKELSKMTDEEILLQADKKDGHTNANTFEEYMKEIGKEYKTAREFIESEDYFDGYYNRKVTDEEYEEEILNCKKYLIGDIEIYNSNNEPYDWRGISITGMGDYELTVKVNETELFSFTITIDQYEVIGWNYNISVYDFKNGNTPKIESASYEYKRDGDTEYTKGNITSEQIVNEENISYIKVKYPKTTYKYQIIVNGENIKGYLYEEAWAS